MPEITVTERQRERLETVEDDLEAAYIDTYGHIRTTDVVEYLLDTYTPPEHDGGDVAYERIATADFQALQAVATDVDGVPGSGIDAETMRGELLSTLGVEVFAARLAEVDDPESDAADGESENAESDDPDSGGTDGDDAESEAGETDDAESEADATSAETESSSAPATASDGDSESDSAQDTGPGSTPATDGPGSVLSAANQLLTDHEDKWREGGSDSPYEVDLPDGTTEKVRTKDDVRGLLFKHY